jgi:hypothetical protein
MTTSDHVRDTLVRAGLDGIAVEPRNHDGAWVGVVDNRDIGRNVATLRAAAIALTHAGFRIGRVEAVKGFVIVSPGDHRA